MRPPIDREKLLAEMRAEAKAFRGDTLESAAGLIANDLVAVALEDFARRIEADEFDCEPVKEQTYRIIPVLINGERAEVMIDEANLAKIRNKEEPVRHIMLIWQEDFFYRLRRREEWELGQMFRSAQNPFVEAATTEDK